MKNLIKANENCMKALVNQRINEILEMWSQQNLRGKPYLLRHCETKEQNLRGKPYLLRHCETKEQYESGTVVIQPTYGDIFYGIDDFINIANACGYSTYLKIQENMDGKQAPTLVISK